MYVSEEINSRTKYAWGMELAWLRRAAIQCNYAVMIGAGPGVMAVALMEGNPELNLLVIDHETCYYTQKHLESAGFNKVGFVVSDSSEYGNKYAGPPLDLLIVDGDHTEEGVTRDIEAWIKHVKSKGMLFFHDLEIVNGDETNGVKEAIWKALKTNVLDASVCAYPGISVVYRKN